MQSLRNILAVPEKRGTDNRSRSRPAHDRKVAQRDAIISPRSARSDDSDALDDVENGNGSGHEGYPRAAASQGVKEYLRKYHTLAKDSPPTRPRKKEGVSVDDLSDAELTDNDVEAPARGRDDGRGGRRSSDMSRGRKDGRSHHEKRGVVASPTPQDQSSQKSTPLGRKRSASGFDELPPAVKARIRTASDADLKQAAVNTVLGRNAHGGSGASRSTSRGSSLGTITSGSSRTLGSSRTGSMESVTKLEKEGGVEEVASVDLDGRRKVTYFPYCMLVLMGVLGVFLWAITAAEE
eukprot:GFYU01003666.1.p1 GENE.GFYU01003666.1~~GFYU01003666.1.p1  ORF type:complete len:294 (-),score=35.63 GFYU01003666.1:144-1025(-)